MCIVKLGDKFYVLVAIGGYMVRADDKEFDTLADAQAWLRELEEGK